MPIIFLQFFNVHRQTHTAEQCRTGREEQTDLRVIKTVPYSVAAQCKLTSFTILLLDNCKGHISVLNRLSQRQQVGWLSLVTVDTAVTEAAVEKEATDEAAVDEAATDEAATDLGIAEKQQMYER
jgi:hypothetical protein